MLTRTLRTGREAAWSQWRSLRGPTSMAFRDENNMFRCSIGKTIARVDPVEVGGARRGSTERFHCCPSRRGADRKPGREHCCATQAKAVQVQGEPSKGADASASRSSGLEFVPPKGRRGPGLCTYTHSVVRGRIYYSIHEELRVLARGKGTTKIVLESVCRWTLRI